MRIVVGGDHSGFEMKQQVVKYLQDVGHDVEDVGTFTPDLVDFPDIAKAVCTKLRPTEGERGILVCGSGVGAVMAANKIRGIRAAVCHDVYSAHQSVEHDDANVMCIGAQIVGWWLLQDLIEAFLNAEFDRNEIYLRRVEKMDRLEDEL